MVPGRDPGPRAAKRLSDLYDDILVAQAGWVLLVLVDTSNLVWFVSAIPLLAIELSGPWIAETHKGGTPWHAHHIAERYGLLAIIALGEGVIGTVASLSAVVEHQGWSVDAGLQVAASFIQGHARIGDLATVLSVTIPVGLFVLVIYALHTYLVGQATHFTSACSPEPRWSSQPRSGWPRPACPWRGACSW